MARRSEKGVGGLPCFVFCGVFGRKLSRFLRGSSIISLVVFSVGFRPNDRTSAVEDSSTVVLRFGGDVLLAGQYETAVGDSVHRAFEDFDLFHTDDVSMVNLEVPVTTQGSKQVKPFTFRMKPKFLEVIPAAGIDVVNLANNHIFDFGKQGLFDTVDHLDSAKIERVGAGKNREDAHRPVIKTIKGKRIAFLGYYSGGEAPSATKRNPGVATRAVKVITKDIKSLREVDSVDYIVVNFHWGIEKAAKPSAQQRAFAHSVIDAGADAIIGHHPHVLQGVEIYNEKVIAYSLGNLVFGGNARSTYCTGVFEIRVSNGGTACSFIPVCVKRWRLSVSTGDEEERAMKEMRELSSIFPKTISF